jgi:hypothetical protein
MNEEISSNYEINKEEYIKNQTLITKYKEELDKLKSTNLSLKYTNYVLAKELKEKNKLITAQYKNIYNVRSFLFTLSEILHCSSYDEIPSKIKNLLNIQSSLQEQNAFISKLKSLYITTKGLNPNDTIDIKEIWQWIKTIVSKINIYLKEKELQDQYQYELICNKLMNKLNFTSFSELYSYIQQLLVLEEFNKNK